jgi:hypothetical protein
MSAKVINLFKRYDTGIADAPTKQVGVMECGKCHGNRWLVIRFVHHENVYLTCAGCQAIFATSDLFEFSEIDAGFVAGGPGGDRGDGGPT